MIPEAIENSKKVLIILSERTRTRFKCTLEIFLALEKCISTNKMCVTIALLGNLDKKDVPKIPMLEHSMIARLTENDQPYTIKKVIENIKCKSCRVNNS
jgi:predicted nucleic acid-binding protein